MEGALNRAVIFLKLKPKEDEQQKIRQEIAQELSRISQRIREVEDLFDLTYDPDMTEAYVYELRSLNAKYSSVLKRARHNGLSAPEYQQNPLS